AHLQAAAPRHARRLRQAMAPPRAARDHPAAARFRNLSTGATAGRRADPTSFDPSCAAWTDHLSREVDGALRPREPAEKDGFDGGALPRRETRLLPELRRLSRRPARRTGPLRPWLQSDARLLRRQWNHRAAHGELRVLARSEGRAGITAGRHAVELGDAG